MSATQSPEGENYAPKVAIVVLNWNGWADTLECLESCLKLDYPQFRTIVCDNGSTDGSIGRVLDWAEGKLDTPLSGPVGRRLCQPVSTKPVSFSKITRHDVGNAAEFVDLPTLTIIDNEENLGFAAGNNIGIRYAEQSGAQFVWLLNNDTVVAPEALSPLVATLSADPAIGICGSVLHFYDRPDVLQLAGGCSYYSVASLSRRICADRPADREFDEASISSRLDYVSGASCLVSRSFLREVGLMTEDYFLYCEEIDWALRARGKYNLGFARGSHVYHKAGGSIGSKGYGTPRSARSSYYLWRAKAMVAHRYHRWGLPGLWVTALAASAACVAKGNRDSARAILSGVLLRSPAPRT